jgi:hypothetical protein
MTRSSPNPAAFFTLIPQNARAAEMVNHKENNHLTSTLHIRGEQIKGLCL